MIRFKSSAKAGTSRIDHIASLAIARKETKLVASLWDKAQLDLQVGDYPIRLDIKHFLVIGSLDFNQYSLFKKQDNTDVKINPFANLLVTRNFNKTILSLGHILHIDKNLGFEQRLTTVKKPETTNVYTHTKLWYNFNGFFVNANFNTLILNPLNKNYYGVSLGWEKDGVSIGARFGSKMQEVGEAPGRLDKYSLNLSKDFGANGAAAIQYKQDLKETGKNRLAVSYQNQVSDNLLLKTRVDEDLNIGVFANYKPSASWLVKSALGSNVMHKYNSPGFLGQPVNFSINIEYNPY